MIDYSRYYRAYAEMKDTLDGDYAKGYLTSAMADADSTEDSLTGNMSNRVIDMDWVLKFEDCVPYIEKAIDEQRKFIEEYNQVDRIDKIKQVRKDAITHLTQHTNLIQSIEPDGSVIPEKLLNTLREDSFATYENRFLYSLIFKSISFIEARFRALQNAPNDSEAHVKMGRELQLNKQKLSFDLSYNFESHEREKINKEEDLESLSDYERIMRLRMKLDDFVNTDLIQALNGCLKVKSPINKTNCIKQDPAFKKCYELWTFIESYLKTGYVLEVDEYDGTMSDDFKQEMFDLMAYEHFVMTISTNPALRDKLDAEYLAEKKRREEEANKPEEEIQRYIEDKIYEARREEMALRLAEVRERESTIMKLEDELEQERARVKELEQKVEELTAVVAQREKELEETREQLRQAIVKVQELEKKVALLEEYIVTLEATVATQAAQINALDQTINEQNAIIEENINTISALNEEKTNLQNTIAERDNTIKVHEVTINQQTQSINACNDKIAEITSSYNALQNEYNDYVNKFKDSESQFKGYEEKIASFEEENKELAHQVRVKDNMLSAKDAIINTAYEDRDKYKEKIEKFDQKYFEIKKRADEMEDKYNQRESEIVGLNNTVKSQSLAMIKLQEELDNLKAQFPNYNY